MRKLGELATGLSCSSRPTKTPRAVASTRFAPPRPENPPPWRRAAGGGCDRRHSGSCLRGGGSGGGAADPILRLEAGAGPPALEPPGPSSAAAEETTPRWPGWPGASLVVPETRLAASSSAEVAPSNASTMRPEPASSTPRAAPPTG